MFLIYCFKSIKYCGNTSNLNLHLQMCTKTTSTCQSTQPISTYFDAAKQKLKKNSKRQNELKLGLSNFVVKDVRPFFLVEGEGFCDFMKVASAEYKVPCSTTITRLYDSNALIERRNLKKKIQISA